jgi:hypothetical protein
VALAAIGFTEGFDTADLKTQRHCSTGWREAGVYSVSVAAVASTARKRRAVSASRE